MVKNSKPSKVAQTAVEAPARKRKQVTDVESGAESSDEEFTVSGLIDDEASEDEDEEASEEENKEASEEENASDSEEENASDSEEELNRLLGEEQDVSDVSDLLEDSEEDTRSLTDKLSGVKLRRYSTAPSEVVETEFADGTPRLLKPEIDPVYDSDDSDVDNFNTIGNIPISAYEELPHIGYDINGKRIMRPARGSALDQLLESIDLPEGWTGLLDQNTGAALNLTQEELELIAKIQNHEQTDMNINPYEPTIEWFTSRTEIMPLTAIPEPKRRFVPSKHEAKRIMKIVKAIREGRIVPPKAKTEDEEESTEQFDYDLWADNTNDTADHIMTLRAPKLPPPTHEESYNPPEEYLLTPEERAAWDATEPADRERNFLPQKFGALRNVPGYQDALREKFERCLDLYLAPRVRHNKLNIDPESLVPELPLPKDLRPFPIKCSTVYAGHTGRVRSLSIDPTGLWLATGGDDGSVRVWEILTGRQVYKIQLVDVKENDEDHIDTVAWSPDAATGILAVAAGESVYLVIPPIFGFDIENAGRLKIESGWGYETFGNKSRGDIDVAGAESDSDAAATTATTPKKDVARWHKPTAQQSADGISVIVTCRKTVKKLSWHRKGDYFVTVAPDSGNTAVLIHQLSKHLSQSPFRKSKGIIMDAKFHPFKPQLFVCSQRYVRIYDLAQQVMIKKLMPGARWLSTIDIHPRGDNLVAASFDKRVLWHDLDLSNTPYKTLRYHEKAVRGIQFHKGLPLFSSASDDGSIHVFHGTVYDDLMSNPLLVPLKKLTGHKVVNNLGVLDLDWHPKEAWLFTAGADGTARLWTT